MADDSVNPRMASGAITAISVVAAVGLLGADILWLMDDRVSLPFRHLVEWQIAPFLSLGLMIFGAWAARRGRRDSEE
ncbi:hypothetical protein [Magnetospirillum molischianum]|uniref:Uncharacterized protein n=1 Tax=Magnetospirillum molischianum DSM 120 TaxID=1150626 RepID=H8FQM1_MAGML|nr:hypothetical protein [Magnetospirillum molischianum]CCG40659.1 hypothetical protein PHAMO_210170 [Magnetospirillum molischianum DSM 120]